MTDAADTPSDAQRQAALDAWEAWSRQPHTKEDWASEGAALWNAAYDALDFSWDGLARTEDEVGYGPFLEPHQGRRTQILGRAR